MSKNEKTYNDGWYLNKKTKRMHCFIDGKFLCGTKTDINECELAYIFIKGNIDTCGKCFDKLADLCVSRKIKQLEGYHPYQ